MNNNLNFQFGMYEPATDSIIINTGENEIIVICYVIYRDTTISNNL